MRRHLICAAMALAAILAAIPADVLQAQSNINVRPMRVVADVPASRTSRVNLRITNNHPTRTEGVSLEVVDLTQDSSGTLQIVDDTMRADLDPDALRYSSRQWVELPAERIEIPPETVLEVPVRISVPPTARGSFVSGVLLQTDEPEPPEAQEAERQAFFSIRFGFLVPLVTDIANRPGQQSIAIEAVEMEFDPALDEEGEPDGDPTTFVTMTIDNEGERYSQVVGQYSVERRVGDNWRTVTRGDFPQSAILPGLTLDLTANLERRLPAGEYRLLANVLVDGRRLPRFENVIEFEGDPSIDEVAYDTTLQMDPPFIEMEIVPGATRTSLVEVTNPSDQPITINMTALTPEPLEGVAMGELMGEDLSAGPWTQIAPASFTLRPLGQRNVRVITRVPRDGVDQRQYYADVLLAGEYADGQSAGETRSTLTLVQPSVSPVPEGSLERLSVAEAEAPSRYFVQTRFVNTGNVHLQPEVEARLLSEEGGVAATETLGGEAGRLLPLGVRDFGGELDLSDLPGGAYVLEARTEVGGDVIARRTPVEIEVDGETRRLTVVQE
jgi:hypothetical protein